MNEKQAFKIFKEFVNTVKSDGLHIKENREKAYNEASDETKKVLLEIIRVPLKELLLMIFKEHTIDEILIFQGMLQNEIACVKKKEGAE